jgi:hypothetical protein
MLCWLSIEDSAAPKCLRAPRLLTQAIRGLQWLKLRQSYPISPRHAVPSWPAPVGAGPDVLHLDRVSPRDDLVPVMMPNHIDVAAVAMVILFSVALVCASVGWCTEMEQRESIRRGMRRIRQAIHHVAWLHAASLFVEILILLSLWSRVFH